MSHRRFISITLLLGLSTFAGCTVDQKAEVSTYRQVLDNEKSSVEVAYETDQPLSLGKTLRLANAHNERLAIRGEDYLQALIDKDRAAANFLPTVSFAPTFLRQKETHAGGGAPLISQFVPKHSLDLPIEAGMQFSPVADAANISRAKATAQAQRAKLLDLQDDVLLDAAATYYQILRSGQQVKVLINSVDVQERRLADVQAKRQAGTALSLDVAQVRLQLARTRALLIRARNDERNGRAMLAYLIGQPQVDGPLTDQLAVPPMTPASDELVSMAGRNRQDLLATQEEIEAASKNLQRAWGQYFPAVSLDFDYYLKRESFPPDVNWIGLVKLRVPLFSAGLIHADVRTALSQLRQARLNQSLVQRRVLKQVRVAQDDLNSSHEQLDQFQEQVDAAQEAMDRSEQEYNAGLATNLDRLVAQDQLLASQLDLTSERLDYKLNYLTLLRVVGQLDVDIATASASLSMAVPSNGKAPADQPR